MRPRYYLGRRMEVFHAASHPYTYVYTFARLEGKRAAVLRMVKCDSYANREGRRTS